MPLDKDHSSGDYALVKGRAISLLARREHSRCELARKINGDQRLAQDELAVLLDNLEQSGYLSDQRFAEMLVRSSVIRGYGPMKILYALREKGVDRSLAEAVLAMAEVDWLESARFQREKKFGQTFPKEPKERARQSRFLAGRGFSIEIINAVFHEKC